MLSGLEFMYMYVQYVLELQGNSLLHLETDYTSASAFNSQILLHTFYEATVKPFRPLIVVTAETVRDWFDCRNGYIL